MNRKNFLKILVSVGMFALSLVAAVGADKKSPVSKVYTAAETTEFKTLAKATIEALGAGKNTEMVAKLTDLETAWDAKEAVLRKRNGKTWEVIDKTLDKAISALRSSKTDMAKGKAALEELLILLEAATKG